MSMTLYTNEPCPRCGKTIRQTTVDLHPTRAGLAIHNFECVDCGPVKSKVYSLKPGKSSARASRIAAWLGARVPAQIADGVGLRRPGGSSS